VVTCTTYVRVTCTIYVRAPCTTYLRATCTTFVRANIWAGHRATCTTFVRANIWAVHLRLKYLVEQLHTLRAEWYLPAICAVLRGKVIFFP
jgi:hypothetical protein